MVESGSPGRIFPDWIDEYKAYAFDPDIPPIFTQWAGISAISSVLERKVWAFTRPEPLYPNLYVLLIGPPGGGKSTAINRAKRIVRQVRNERQRFVKFAPDDITKAALLDAFKSALVIETLGDTISEQSPVYLAVDELSTAINFLSTELLSFLSKMFDADDSYIEQRRGRSDKPMVIPYPILSLLAGVQPGYLAQTVPSYAWEQGFIARFVMLYADAKPRRTLFPDTQMLSVTEDGLRRDLTQMFQLQGTLSFSEKARQVMATLAQQGLTPVPDHQQLVNYVQRRMMYLAKLAMVSSCSSSNSMIITESDVLRARGWLLEAESTMPGIFWSMKGQSDDALLSEARRAIAIEYQRTGQPVPTNYFYRILSQRAKSQQVKQLFQVAIHRGDYQQGTEEGGWNSLIPTAMSED